MNDNPTDTRTAVLLHPQRLWLDAIDRILGRIALTVVAKAVTPETALDAVAEYRPDLLVAGIGHGRPGSQLFDSIVRARRRRPALKVVVIAADGDPNRISEAFAAGAAAYVVETAHPEDLRAAVRQAFDHSVYFPSSIAAAHAVPVHEEPPALTRRELEILQLVAEGHSNAQVGRLLWVTEQTVKFHLSNVYRKIDVGNRTEASRWAQARNLLAPARSRERALSVVG